MRFLIFLWLVSGAAFAGGQPWIDDAALKAYFATVGVKIYSTEFCSSLFLPKSKLLRVCAKEEGSVRFSCVDRIKVGIVTKQSKDWKLVPDKRFQKNDDDPMGVWHNSCSEAKRMAELRARSGKAFADAPDDIKFGGMTYRKSNQGNRSAAELQKITKDKTIKEVASYCGNARYLVEKCKALKPEDRVACVSHPDRKDLSPSADWKMLANPELLAVTNALTPQAYFTVPCNQTEGLVSPP